jgi:hypothetical protein
MRMPKCGNCTKWGTTCDFTAWSAAVRPLIEKQFAESVLYFVPAYHAHETTHTERYRRTLATVDALAYPMPLASFDADDLGLLRHYATTSSLTLAPKESLFLFQVNVPGEAKSHLFLMHSVLAFSALHLSVIDTRNRDRHMHNAFKQHHEALVCFRDTVKEVTVENGGAVTAFSFLILVYTIGLPIVFGFNDETSPLDSFIDILHVLRGAWAALGPNMAGVESGNLRELVKPQPKKMKPCVMHAMGAKVVRSLSHFLDTSPIVEDEHRQTYREALMHWERFFMNSPCKPPLWANALVWTMTAPHAYFKLLQEKRPFALIIFANWAIALVRAPNMWFNAWAREVVADIWQISSEETRRGLMWPAEVCGIIPKNFHPQDCVCWACREGDPYLAVRDNAAAVLVDRTRGDIPRDSPERQLQPVQPYMIVEQPAFQSLMKAV